MKRRGSPRPVAIVAWTLATLGAAWAPLAAHAAELTAASHLERARVCRAALDVACVEAELAAARANPDGLSAAQRDDLLRLSAEAALAAERLEEARTYVADLLRAQPDFDPDPRAWPGPWRALLADVRASLPDEVAPRVDARAPAAATAGQPIVVRAVVQDPAGIARVELVLTAPDAVRLAMTDVGANTWEGTIPGELVRGDCVNLVVEAWDRRGNGPGRSAPLGQPHRVVIASPVAEAPPIYERWWFWTAAGVAVAVVATGLIIALDDPGPGAVHRVEGAVTWP